MDVNEGTIDLPASFNSLGEMLFGPVAFEIQIFDYVRFVHS